mmetsp:Transcript_9282/g.37547  ORF Transcript_9282/g.37547 Transcript_9282/m.37547 type:complete len:201 (+) Transcript_9282:1463-2065(+)
MITQKPPLSFFLAGLGGDLAGDLVTGFDGVFFVTPPLGATAFALGVAAFAARLAEGGLVGVTTAGLAGDFLAGVFFAGVFLAGVFLTGDLAGDLGAGLAGDLAGVLALEGVLPVLGVRALHLSDRSLLLRPLRGVENLGSLRILAQLLAPCAFTPAASAADSEVVHAEEVLRFARLIFFLFEDAGVFFAAFFFAIVATWR